MGVFSTLRNNWKKSIFFAGVAAFGANWAQQKYKESLILKAYCLEAKKYGDVVLPLNQSARKVTVFLNPAAYNGKSKKLFEKNVAPLLHLAGLEVTVVKTEYEGQAKKYMEVVDPTDALVVAGGDGTLSEVVTGLLRRTDQEQFSKVPLGVIPLGTTNTLAKTLCPRTDSPIRLMAEMTMSVVRGEMKPVDVLHIEGDGDKSVYTVTGMQWGAFTDAEQLKKKYWYFGPLKHRLTYVLSSLRHWPPTYTAHLTYKLPCGGCSACYVPPPPPQRRWWNLFVPGPREVLAQDMSGVVNVECGKEHTRDSNFSHFAASTENCQPDTQQKSSGLRIQMIGDDFTKSGFIKHGWSRLRGDVGGHTEISAAEFTLTPTIPQGQESWFIIDNDQFEPMNVRCKLLPNKLFVFHSPTFTVPLEGDAVHRQTA